MEVLARLLSLDVYDWLPQVGIKEDVADGRDRG